MSSDGTLELFTVGTDGRYHVEDHWTSKAAARSAAVRAGAPRYLILELLIGAPPSVGFTAFELGARLNLLAHVAGTRLGELVAAGYAQPALDLTGNRVRRPTDTGRTALAYTVTEAGRNAYKAAAPAMAPRVADAPRSAGTRPPGRPTAPLQPTRRGLERPVDRVLELLVDATRHPATRGLTDDELATLAGLLPSAAGTYRKQLTDAGLAALTDRTRRTRRRQPAAIHVATAAGMAHLDRIARR